MSVVAPVLSPRTAAAAAEGAQLDWKTALQEVMAARGLGVPDYRITESGPDHDKRFAAQVLVAGEPLGAGDGRSKKEAEQVAAEAACSALAGTA